MVGTLWRTPRLRRLPECVTCGAPLVSARELELRICTYCIPMQHMCCMCITLWISLKP